VRRRGSGLLLKHVDDRLRAGQAARAEQHQHAVAGSLEHGHLAELGVLFTPAWVRESLAKIRPSSSLTPTQ
jgi:hypothetical protein